MKDLDKPGVRDSAPSHGDILAALFKDEEATMTELSDIVHRDRFTVTALYA